MREPSRERRRRRAPTPADIVVLVLLALTIPVSQRWTRGDGAAVRLVVRDAHGERRFDATRDLDLQVRGPLGDTHVRVADGEAWIVAAPCRKQLCRRMGRLRGPGRSLVCIPNRVVVRFEGATGAAQPDAVTR